MASQVFRQKVAVFAFYSRILVIVMQSLFNCLMPDHDAKVFNPPVPADRNAFEWLVRCLLEGFRRWDGVYFQHIAEHGYTYENTLAFFPLFPMVSRCLASTVFLPLQYVMSYSYVLLISATAFNTFCFVQSAKILFDLALKILHDEVLAYKAAQLFSINPASIFFSAAYSEASYALLTFSGLLELEKKNYVKSALFFSLSGATRSNGLINFAFIVYYKMVDLCAAFARLQKGRFVDLTSELSSILRVLFATLGSLLALACVCALPFLTYQYYAYTIYCNPAAGYRHLKPHVLKYGSSNGYHMPHMGVSPWCANTPPMSYSYVQKNHWNVGFLEYYQYKQIPNFLMAAPMLLICMSALVTYLLRNPVYCLTLGLYDPDHGWHKKSDMNDFDSIFMSRSWNYGFTSRRCFVHVMHMASLAIFAALFMHVQVTTRFIASSCPVIYFFVAWVTTPTDQLQPVIGGDYDNDLDLAQASVNNSSAENNGRSPPAPARNPDDMDWDSSWVNTALFLYFHLYFFVGIGAFSNFLPWT